MRRTHLRGHGNILKRLYVHVGGFNLGLLMRTLVGVGTPRGLQGRLMALVAAVLATWTDHATSWADSRARIDDRGDIFTPHHRFELLPVAAGPGV
jgi:hypothetical protein